MSLQETSKPEPVGQSQATGPLESENAPLAGKTATAPTSPSPLPTTTTTAASQATSTSTAAASAASSSVTATAAPDKSTSAFPFPWEYTLPPFFTLQPNPTTRQAHLAQWSALIQAYCRHTRTTRLPALSDATLASPLFHNAALGRRLKRADVRTVVDWMASAEGERRAEWVETGAGVKGKGSGGAEGREECWVYWRTLEEWAGAIADWIEETGQRGSVLTLFELTHSDATRNAEFHDLDPELLQKALNVLVKKGKAQIFGSEDQQGVKFF